MHDNNQWREYKDIKYNDSQYNLVVYIQFRSKGIIIETEATKLSL